MASPIIQLADMPATPLARCMWRFGWPGAEDQLHAVIAPEVPVKVRADVAKRPGHIAPCTVAAAVRETCASRTTLSDRAEVSSKPIHAHARVEIARYESKDPATGRVWGMPSAFGRGQCLDCPKKAAPPSARCEACQVRLAQTLYEPMPTESLEQVRKAFDSRLECTAHAKKREDIIERLRVLIVALQEGRISQPVQAHLLELARAISVTDLCEANRLCTVLIAKHWDEHREWLQGLKRLLARQ